MTRKTTIWMAKNDTDAGHRDPEVVAVCMGTVTVDRIKRVGRKQKVRWRIKNDEDGNLCEPPVGGNIESYVELHFEDKIWVDPLEIDSDTPTKARRVSVLKYSGGNKIEGRVFFDNPPTNPPTVPNGSYKYWVVYMNKQASPDPEIDVIGDCGGCGPK